MGSEEPHQALNPVAEFEAATRWVDHRLGSEARAPHLVGEGLAELGIAPTAFREFTVAEVERAMEASPVLRGEDRDSLALLMFAYGLMVGVRFQQERTREGLGHTELVDGSGLRGPEGEEPESH